MLSRATLRGGYALLTFLRLNKVSVEDPVHVREANLSLVSVYMFNCVHELVAISKSNSYDWNHLLSMMKIFHKLMHSND